MNALARGAAIVVALGLPVACAATQTAARHDPMQCERDPNCARYRGSYADCTQQCADNPECVDRCRGAQADPGLGH